MKTILHPVAGYLANCAPDRLTGYVADMQNRINAGLLVATERQLLRDLARRVAEIAALPIQQEKRQLWFGLCRLQPVRPMLLVFPEDSWNEIIPPAAMTIQDPFWAQQEWYLRHLIYRHQHIRDDFVIQPEVYVATLIQRSDWGLVPKFVRKDEKGSYIWEPPIRCEADLDKLRYPEITVDDEQNQRNLAQVADVLGDILPVKAYGFLPGMLTYDTAAMLRGIEELMMDMYDRPA